MRPTRFLPVLRALPLMGVACAVLLGLAAGPRAHAADAAALLAKASATARSASYSGVYVYTSAGVSESARVTRLHDASGDGERIESLDGTRREVVRRGDEIHYFFLDTKTVRVDRRVSGRSFPDVLPADTAALSAHYLIESGAVDRVAGRAVQVLRLRAKDDKRYSQEVWVDQQTSLPLKLRVLDDKGETLEQFAFTELTVGERINPKQTLPSRRAGYAGWKVESVIFSTLSADAVPAAPRADGKVDAKVDGKVDPKSERVNGSTEARKYAASGVPEPRWLPPGFRLLTQVSRQWPGSDRVVVQSVYSDGLATLSVFVDPDTAKVAGREGSSQRGAVGVVSRLLGNRALITVGELPVTALRKVSESTASVAR
jgi:sigma-E factor negative regulatory protein RseB